MSIYCTNCGQENADKAIFCEKCGAKLRKPQKREETVNSNLQTQNENNQEDTNNQNFNNQPNQQNTNPVYVADEKSPGVAALLSFLIMGAGFLYIDDGKKFAIYFLIGVLLGFLAIITMGILLIAYIPFYIYQIYDTYKQTEEYNNKKRQLYQNMYNQ